MNSLDKPIPILYKATIFMLGIAIVAIAGAGYLAIRAREEAEREAGVRDCL